MFKKRAYSVFYETDLNLLLRSLGVDTVILTGLIPIYVRHTVVDAFSGIQDNRDRDVVDVFTEKAYVEGF